MHRKLRDALALGAASAAIFYLPAVGMGFESGPLHHLGRFTLMNIQFLYPLYCLAAGALYAKRRGFSPPLALLPALAALPGCVRWEGALALFPAYALAGFFGARLGEAWRGEGPMEVERLKKLAKDSLALGGVSAALFYLPFAGMLSGGGMALDFALFMLLNVHFLYPAYCLAAGYFIARRRGFSLPLALLPALAALPGGFIWARVFAMFAIYLLAGCFGGAISERGQRGGE